MLARRALWLLTVLWWALPATPVAAHPGYFGTAFHAHDLDSAITAARIEHKLVFAYLGRIEGESWAALRWRTAGLAPILDLLVREAVMVEVIASDLDGVAGAPGEAPALLVLGPDRRLRAVLDAKAPLGAIERQLERALGGAEGLSRAEALRAERPEDDFFARERLASALWRHGDRARALTLAEPLAREAVEATTTAAKVRRPQLLQRLTRWARSDPAARGLLLGALTRAEARLEAGATDARLAQAVASSYESLDLDGRTARLFDALEGNRAARAGLFDAVAERLVASGHEGAALELIEPESAFEGERAFYDLMRISRPVLAERGHDRGSRRFVVERGLLLVGALHGAGRAREAEALARAVAGFDDSPATIARLTRMRDRATASER